MVIRRYASPACALSEIQEMSSSGRVLRPPRVMVKRVYEPAQRGDGLRVLVDRLWPRGLSKHRANVALWARDLAPSTELRLWFHHDPSRWSQFKRRYRKELADHSVEVEALRLKARARAVTLLYAARDTEHNHALLLKAAIEDA